MPIRTRTESKEFKIHTFLNSRMALPPIDKRNYLNLKKGYEGEVMFDTLTASLDQKFLILPDLLLESNNTTFQIDSLMITQESLIPWEVKNYEGNYYFENDNFFLCSNQNPITNPLHQLNRSETLLRTLLKGNGFHLPVEGNLSFINPEFFLYQAPQNKKIVFRPQLNSTINNLNSRPSNLNGTHRKIADFLLSAHIPESKNIRLPSYDYAQLRKGVNCGRCYSSSVTYEERKIVCKDCGYEEYYQSVVVRSIEELVLLFPDIKITAKVVYDWCRLGKHSRKIRRILSANYKILGHGPHSYYVNK